jgi:hypothetical protein
VVAAAAISGRRIAISCRSTLDAVINARAFSRRAEKTRIGTDRRIVPRPAIPQNHPPALLCLGTLVVVLTGAVTGCVRPNPRYRERARPTDATGITFPDARGPADAPIGRDRPVGDSGAPDQAGGDAPDAGLVPEPPDAVAPDGVVGAGTAALLAAWGMDDGPGSKVASASSGHDLDGALVEMDPDRAWVPGRKGGTALEFAPTPALPHPGVRVALTPALQGLQRFTVAAWVYLTGLTMPVQMSVFSQQMNDTLYETFSLGFVDSKLLFLLPGAGLGAQTMYSVRATDVTPVGRWVHVAATFDGQKGRLYRNGLLIDSLDYARSLPVSDKPIYIGTNVNPGNEQPFVGYIDDVLIYDGPLSGAAIDELARP